MFQQSSRPLNRDFRYQLRFVILMFMEKYYFQYDINFILRNLASDFYQREADLTSLQLDQVPS